MMTDAVTGTIETENHRSARWPASGPIDGQTARDLVARGAKLVDVRTAMEFAQVHAAGALNLPVERIHALAGQIGATGTPVVLYCRSGHRSAIALQILARLGYEHVWDFGPLTAWKGDFERG